MADILGTFKEREKQYATAPERALKGFPEEFTQRQTDLTCLPPKVKEQFIKDLVRDIDNAVKKVADKEDVERYKANIARYLYALAVVKDVPSCEASDSPEIVMAVTERLPQSAGLPGYEALVGDLIRTRIVDPSLTRLPSGKRKSVTDEFPDIDEEADAEAEAASEGLTAAELQARRDLMVQQGRAKRTRAEGLPPVQKFAQHLHTSILWNLNGLVYDGADKPTDMLFSPCGIVERRYDERTAAKLGMTEENLQKMAIFDAMDKLAFIGSGQDWIDYYHDGKSAVVGDRFHPISERDWPGCWRDLYEGRRDYKDELTDAELQRIVSDMGLPLRPDDFVEFKKLKARAEEGGRLPAEGYEG